jgi:hypothetical protein
MLDSIFIAFLVLLGLRCKDMTESNINGELSSVLSFVVNFPAKSMVGSNKYFIEWSTEFGKGSSGVGKPDLKGTLLCLSFSHIAKVISAFRSHLKLYLWVYLTKKNVI